MAISTNGTVLARVAGALYNTQLSNATYSEIAAQDPSTLANTWYSRDFASKTDLTVAQTLLANLGLSSVAGLDNWVAAQLTAAGTGNKGAKIVSMLNDFAQMTSDATYGASATSFNSKVDVALALAQTDGNTGGTFEAVSSIAASGSTYTLTTSTNNLTGTANDDTFNADASSSTTQTLNTSDRVSGGAGNDTLNASVYTSVTPQSISGVETINLTAGATATVTTSNFSGVNTINNVGSTAALTVAALSSTATKLAVSDVAGATTEFAYTTSTVAGTADSASLTVSNISGSNTITISGIETLNVTASGGDSTLAAITNSSLKTLNVAGDKALTLTALPATVTVIDASAKTGGGFTTTIAAGGTGTMTITGGAGNDSINMAAVAGDSTISLGAGDDKVTFDGTGTLTSADTIDGGDGIDTVVSTAARLEAVTALRYLTNFETLELSDNDVTTALDTTNFGAITKLVLPTGTDGAYTVTFATGGGTINLGKTAGTTANLAGNLGITVSGTSTTDTATLSYASDSADSAGYAVSTTGVETLVISNSKLADTVGTITMVGTEASATTVSLTGSKSMTLGAVSATNVDASGMTTSTGALTMASSGNTATNVTGGAGNDTLYGHGTSATTITGGDGLDTIYGGTGNDVAYGGAGNDTISLSTGTDKAYGEDGDDIIVIGSGLSSSDIIDGGAGADTIQLDAAVASTTNGARISNIETIEFTTAASQDMNYLVNGGVTTVKYSATGTTAITSAPATLANLTFSTSADATVASMARWTDTSTDSITLNLGSATTGSDSDPAALTINDDETIVIKSNGVLGTTANSIATFSATDAKTITITGAGSFAVGTGYTVASSSTGSSATTIDASAATGAITLTASATAGLYGGITYIGGSGVSTFTGGLSSDNITGGSSDDSLDDGAGGDDTISGGAGNDTIYAYDGADSLDGGSGTDTISYANNWTLDDSADNDTDGGLEKIDGIIINLSASAVTLATVNSNTEMYIATSSVAAGTAQYLFSGTSNSSTVVDTLLNFENATGSSGSDYIIGSTAANVLNGGAANDLIDGGSGNDTIDAGAGNDMVYASSGTDSITLGSGNDTFRFSAADGDTLLASWTAESVVISDFVAATDKLLAFGYKTGTTAPAAGSSTNYGEELTAAASLTAYLTAADTALDGTVEYYFGVVSGNGYLAYDDDGTGMTYVIKLTGVTDLAYTDIVAASTNASVTGLLGLA